MWSFGTKVVPMCTVCLFERCEVVFQHGLHDGTVFKSSAFAVKPVFGFQTKMPGAL